ncbi:MAG TPA: SCO family protein [Candidatus Acidoferrum sp.]|jgi:protein SCO1/2|nr:SCO family protein [Candidatus Acidoferrum sp.]
MKQENRHVGKPRLVALAVLVVAIVAIASCSKQSQQTQTAAQGSSAVPANAKVYHLHGKVLSIDPANSRLDIDGDAVPDFMAAMAMPYTVHDKAEIAKVASGDEINADIIVPQDAEAYIQNIVVLKKGSGSGTPSSSNIHEPQPGDAVPDFALVDQDGKHIHLSQFRGDALLVTFIYTRCPFPDYCPLVSRNFGHIYADTKSNPELRDHLRLLSVSFDPENDTPAALRAYAKTFDGTTGGNPFGRWEFAVVPKDELQKVTDYFGVTVAQNGGQIVHSMSTSVITPDGKIYSWREDTDWKPADLIADASAALAPAGAQTAADMRGAGHAIAAPAAN